jgi:hypothetical protein
MTTASASLGTIFVIKKIMTTASLRSATIVLQYYIIIHTTIQSRDSKRRRAMATLTKWGESHDGGNDDNDETIT